MLRNHFVGQVRTPLQPVLPRGWRECDAWADPFASSQGDGASGLGAVSPYLRTAAAAARVRVVRSVSHAWRQLAGEAFVGPLAVSSLRKQLRQWKIPSADPVVRVRVIASMSARGWMDVPDSDWPDTDWASEGGALRWENLGFSWEDCGTWTTDVSIPAAFPALQELLLLLQLDDEGEEPRHALRHIGHLTALTSLTVKNWRYVCICC